ncbi:MAG: glycine cleavage system aminomethyltransferase GcvT [Negativicutes bacterium]|jgi:aminomethyltransferase
MSKRTSLYEQHIAAGGKMVEYAGWELPVQYAGLAVEHEAVRTTAGIFDVSHMGEALVFGPESEEFLNYLLTNAVDKLEDNKVLYSLMCYPDGGVVDDLLVYRFVEREYFLVINAANIAKDLAWMTEQATGFAVQIVDVSSETSEIALQGPDAERLLQQWTKFDLNELKFFECAREVEIVGCKCLISRTGYTGEDGFEIYTANDYVAQIWQALIAAGAQPCGLGCRDTLRFEAGLPLYGYEISANISPLEAGLGMFVRLEKPDFVGKQALLAAKEQGLARKTVGFELLDKGIPRHGYEVQIEGKTIGTVTTGYLSPTLKKSIGLALIDSDYAKPDGEFAVLMRGKLLRAKIISRQFIKKNYKK